MSVAIRLTLVVAFLLAAPVRAEENSKPRRQHFPLRTSSSSKPKSGPSWSSVAMNAIVLKKRIPRAGCDLIHVLRHSKAATRAKPSSPAIPKRACSSIRSTTVSSTRCRRKTNSHPRRSPSSRLGLKKVRRGQLKLKPATMRPRSLTLPNAKRRIGAGSQSLIQPFPLYKRRTGAVIRLIVSSWQNSNNKRSHPPCWPNDTRCAARGVRLDGHAA